MTCGTGVRHVERGSHLVGREMGRLQRGIYCEDSDGFEDRVEEKRIDEAIDNNKFALGLAQRTITKTKTPQNIPFRSRTDGEGGVCEWGRGSGIFVTDEGEVSC